MGLKITALALCCALLGGAVGGGVAWGVSQAAGSTSSINVSNRPATQVAIKTVDGKTEMTDAEVYAANVNSVVSINTTGTSGTNFFGQAVQTASAGSGFVLTRGRLHRHQLPRGQGRQHRQGHHVQRRHLRRPVRRRR